MTHPTTPTASQELPVLSDRIAPSSQGGCCGGACATATSNETSNETSSGPAANTAEKENPMTERTTQNFRVTGMTCGHCAGAVTEELKQLPGVVGIDVALVAGGVSTVKVTGTEPLSDDLVATALEEAGDYQLA